MKANPAYIEEVKEFVRKSLFPEHMAMRLRIRLSPRFVCDHGTCLMRG